MIGEKQTRIGTDEWVSRHTERLKQPRGMRGWLNSINQRVPCWGWIGLLLAIGLVFPAVFDGAYPLRIAGSVMLTALISLGLNLVVGQAGLLDLGYIAFYGLGAYAYAYLSSDFIGIHLPIHLSLPLIVVVIAGCGWLLGWLTLRLSGDYLAIVTLGFGLVFVQLATNLTNVRLPGLAEAVDLTGGPNGITRLDAAYGLSAEGYHVLLLLALVTMLVLMRNLSQSRIGRSWRALREDPLAAEMMGIPVQWVRMQAFAVGAAVAGAGGALFAGWQGAIFPTNFETASLIMLYAVVILGGLGSLPGVLVGAVVMVTLPEVLRNPDFASLGFYIALVIVLLTTLKPRWQIIPLLGFVAPLSLLALHQLPARLDPEVLTNLGNLAFVFQLGLVLVMTRLEAAHWRFVLIIPTLCLLIFAWEMRLSQEPAETRLILLGALLVVLMIYRPQGIFGREQKEIV